MFVSITTRCIAAVALTALLAGAAQARSVTTDNGGGGGLVRTACESTFSGPGLVDIDCEDYTAAGGNSLGEARALVTAFQGASTHVGADFRQPTLGYIDSLVTGNAGTSSGLFDASFDLGSRTGTIRLLQALADEFVLNLVVLQDLSGNGQLTHTTGYFFFGAQADRGPGTTIAFRLPDDPLGANLTDVAGLGSVTLYRPAATVPEPGGLLLAASALGALALASRSRRRHGMADAPAPAVPTGLSA